MVGTPYWRGHRGTTGPLDRAGLVTRAAGLWPRHRPSVIERLIIRPTISAASLTIVTTFGASRDCRRAVRRATVRRATGAGWPRRSRTIPVFVALEYASIGSVSRRSPLRRCCTICRFLSFSLYADPQRYGDLDPRLCSPHSRSMRAPTFDSARIATLTNRTTGVGIPVVLACSCASPRYSGTGDGPASGTARVGDSDREHRSRPRNFAPASTHSCRSASWSGGRLGSGWARRNLKGTVAPPRVCWPLSAFRLRGPDSSFADPDVRAQSLRFAVISTVGLAQGWLMCVVVAGSSREGNGMFAAGGDSAGCPASASNGWAGAAVAVGPSALRVLLMILLICE